MKLRVLCKPTLIAVLIVISGLSNAADDARHPCAQVRDDTDRLACYDQAFGKPAAPEAPATGEQFGFKEKEIRRQAGQAAEPGVPASINAAITSLARLRDGKFVVTLDNAQVWSQSEFNSQADVQIGDAITVRRGALGSYLLVTKAGIATRVKRVK